MILQSSAVEHSQGTVISGSDSSTAMSDQAKQSLQGLYRVRGLIQLFLS